MEQLNHALEKMDIENPYYVSNLTEKILWRFFQACQRLDKGRGGVCLGQ